MMQASDLPATLSVPTFPFSMFEAVDKKEWSILEDIFHTNIIYERPGYATLRGLDDVMHFYREVRNVSQGRHQVTDVITANDKVVCQGHFACRTLLNEKIKTDFCDVYTMKDGRVRFRKTFFYSAVI